LLAGLAVVLVTSACAGAQGGDPGANLRGRVLISAASSLTDAFAAIESSFEAAHPGVDVVVNYGGSSSLREQILEGAPVDVFASASPATMDEIVRSGDVSGQATIFARNRLEIAVPKGNPAGVTGLADFGRDDLLLGLCAEGVPCGDFARQALAKAGVMPAIDTNEPDVRALLTKIEAGELDAGITYVTDVAATAGAVDGVDIPQAENVVADYPIAVLAGAPNPTAAQAFVDFVTSAEGRKILAGFGFLSP
jgi:molybdate transport system substrate-binding protein